MSGGEYRSFAVGESLALKVAADAPARSRLLEFIRARFRACFDAVVADDSPTLVGAFNARDELVACFGLRDAASGFFCEHYLGERLDATLSAAFQRPVGRVESVEVTHLCSTEIGVLTALVPLLTIALTERGHRYLVCTATSRLASFFERKGLQPIVLAWASADRLPEAERSHWGRYYAAAPRVLAGDLRRASEWLGLHAPTERAAVN